MIGFGSNFKCYHSGIHGLTRVLNILSHIGHDRGELKECAVLKISESFF
jgi:hypothetical protein